MITAQPNFQEASPSPGATASPRHLTAPLLYLSSLDTGWEGLEAQAFHEPAELDGWLTTPRPEIGLVLFSGGAMRVEQRHIGGPWKARYLGQGDLLVTPGGGKPYEVRWKGLSTRPMQTLHLYLNQELFSSTAAELGGCELTTLSPGVERAVLRDPLLAEIGFALWRELAKPSPMGKLYVETVAQMLTVHLLHHYSSGNEIIKAPSQGLTVQQLRQVEEFVQEHLGHDLTLKALARHIGTSPYYFARRFRLATGESPHRFVLRQRLERAQHLLKETHEPLAQIALESGFANQSHLTRVFKEHFGFTPRAYRQGA